MSEPYMVSAKARIDQIHPMADIVLVRRIPDAEVTASGLIIPDIARNKREVVRIGEVLRVGPGDTVRASVDEFKTMPFRQTKVYLAENDESLKWISPMECRVGDRILYHRCPDNDVTIDGVDCVLLREEQHVLAILETA